MSVEETEAVVEEFEVVEEEEEEEEVELVLASCGAVRARLVGLDIEETSTSATASI